MNRSIQLALGTAAVVAGFLGAVLVSGDDEGEAMASTSPSGGVVLSDGSQQDRSVHLRVPGAQGQRQSQPGGQAAPRHAQVAPGVLPNGEPAPWAGPLPTAAMPTQVHYDRSAAEKFGRSPYAADPNPAEDELDQTVMGSEPERQWDIEPRVERALEKRWERQARERRARRGSRRRSR